MLQSIYLQWDFIFMRTITEMAVFSTANTLICSHKKNKLKFYVQLHMSSCHHILWGTCFPVNCSAPGSCSLHRFYVSVCAGNGFIYVTGKQIIQGFSFQWSHFNVSCHWFVCIVKFVHRKIKTAVSQNVIFSFSDTEVGLFFYLLFFFLNSFLTLKILFCCLL